MLTDSRHTTNHNPLTCGGLVCTVVQANRALPHWYPDGPQLSMDGLGHLERRPLALSLRLGQICADFEQLKAQPRSGLLAWCLMSRLLVS
jgi:hypothetical protein